MNDLSALDGDGERERLGPQITYNSRIGQSRPAQGDKPTSMNRGQLYGERSARPFCYGRHRNSHPATVLDRFGPMRLRVASPFEPKNCGEWLELLSTIEQKGSRDWTPYRSAEFCLPT
jgi:hypothetical protein